VKLVYIADPMCSWCYGFGPELEKLLKRHPEAELDVVMGGLRPFNKQATTPQFREMLREHWRHVSTASGLPFSESALERPGFVYDTEPACRAVVTARALDPAKALAYMKAVQLAFYRDARDVTSAGELAEIAGECGFERDTFRMHLDSEAMSQRTRDDFMRTQSLGVSGFPTLGVQHGEQLYLVTSGYVTDDVLEYRLAEIDRLAGPRASAA
jgi:putative protein-disulfide isomerase